MPSFLYDNGRALLRVERYPPAGQRSSNLLTGTANRPALEPYHLAACLCRYPFWLGANEPGWDVVLNQLSHNELLLLAISVLNSSAGQSYPQRNSANLGNAIWGFALKLRCKCSPPSALRFAAKNADDPRHQKNLCLRSSDVPIARSPDTPASPR